METKEKSTTAGEENTVTQTETAGDDQAPIKYPTPAPEERTSAIAAMMILPIPAPAAMSSGSATAGCKAASRNTAPAADR